MLKPNLSLELGADVARFRDDGPLTLRRSCELFGEGLELQRVFAPDNRSTMFATSNTSFHRVPVSAAPQGGRGLLNHAALTFS